LNDVKKWASEIKDMPEELGDVLKEYFSKMVLNDLNNEVLPKLQ
jgi:hypothetical protein